MSLVNFRTLAAQWQLDRRNADKQRLLRLQDECRAAGKPVPTQLAARSSKVVAFKSLPNRPDWARNWKRDPPTDEENTVVRTKSN